MQGLILRDPEPRDHALLAELRADGELQRLLLGARAPLAEPVAGWLNRRQAAGFFQVAATPEGPLGYVQIADIHRDSRSGWLGIVLAPGARGRGMGAAVMAALHGAARDDLELFKLKLAVRADNERARALYRRIGYRTVGTLRAEYDDGATRHDVVVMEFLLGDQPR